MPDPQEKPANNPAQVRGGISRGQAGKRPGIDPAAAPLETDSEAGGAGLSEEEVAISRASQREATPRAGSQDPAGLSYGAAMAPASRLQGAATGRRLMSLLALLVVAVLIIIAFI